MRVLLVSVKSKKIYGGIATWTDYFLESCKVSGIEVHLVNTEVVGKRLETETASRDFLDEYKRTKRIFGDLKSFLSSNSYSAVHLNTSCGTLGIIRDYLIAKKIKKNNLRLITHYHCDIPDWVKNRLGKHYLKKLCGISDVNVVLCNRSKKYLEDNFGASCIIMPNFVNDELVLNTPKEIKGEIKTAVFVGRVCRAKGADKVLELAKRFPDITFKLIGKPDDDVVKSDSPVNVEIPGTMSHEDLIKHLDEADLFVLPSISEGFSLALTEAMARGIPIVATDVGANKDMLSGGCGIVTAVGDVDAMEKAICELDSIEKRRDMSLHSVEKIRENYVSSVVINRILEMYE